MSHLQPEELPYGIYYCRTCCDAKACDVAVGCNRADPGCPLECLTCGERIGEEVDVRGRYPLPDLVERRQTLTSEQRAAGRALIRRAALGRFAEDLIVGETGSAAAPSPGYRERAIAELERMKGRA
jgi:hypothetical protein